MISRLRFLADEDFDNDIVRGCLRRSPDFDIVRVQDVELSGKHDHSCVGMGCTRRASCADMMLAQ